MKTILNLPEKKIEDLPFTDGLKKILLREGHSSLEDLLNIPAKAWMQYREFDYHCLHEIVGYLRENELVEYLRH